MMGPTQLTHTHTYTDPHTHTRTQHTLSEDARRPSQTQQSKDERDLSQEEELRVELKKKEVVRRFSKHVLEKYDAVLLHFMSLIKLSDFPLY